MQHAARNDTAAPSSRTSALMAIAVVLLLVWIAAVVTLAQRQMAPTFDEQNHVTRGIAILRTGDYRLSLDHPPLANILEALPVFQRPNGFSPTMPDWVEPRIWRAAAQTIWARPADGVPLILDARPPVLLFTLGLALLIFCWAKALFGPKGGLFALALFALDPTMLAHGGLATTDMAAACTFILALFLLRGHLQRPSAGRLLLAGLGLGLALSAKFSALILLPIIGLMFLVVALRPPRDDAHPSGAVRRVLRAAGAFALLLLVAGVVVWGVYGFSVEPLGAKPGQPLPATASALDRVPVPAMQYLRGVKQVITSDSDHRAYLLGQTDPTGKGWWYYFPVAMAVKTPVPELLAILGILLLSLAPRVRARLALAGREWLLLLLPAAVYFLAALGILGISLNLGIRHVMPLYPLLLILAGGWMVLLPHARLRGVVAGSLLAAQCASVLFAYPDFLAYFNEPARLPHRTRPVLVDSNLDWGQDLGRLAAYQQTFDPQSHSGTLYFSYFGTTPPAAYGLRCVPLAGFGLMRTAPPPDWPNMHGYLAISATNLYGGPGYAGADYRALLAHRPERIIGKTIYLYRLPLTAAGGGS